MESPLGERFEIIPPDEVKPTASASAFMVTKAYDSLKSRGDSKSITKDKVMKNEEKSRNGDETKKFNFMDAVETEKSKSNSKDGSEETPITKNKGFLPIAPLSAIEMIDNGVGEDDVGGPPASPPDDDVV